MGGRGQNQEEGSRREDDPTAREVGAKAVGKESGAYGEEHAFGAMV